MDEREFIEHIVALVPSASLLAPLDEHQRGFVDGLLSLVHIELSSEDPTSAFERVVMDRWQEIVWRVQGVVAARFAELDSEQHRFVRAFEHAPSLLAPLGCERDEVTYSRLLAWALDRRGELGRALRGSFLDLLGVELPKDGWSVRNESTIGPGCRVDVEIVVPGQWRCLIEVKIDAPERADQLADYRQYLDEACRSQGLDGELVFLTVDGREGNTEASHVALPFRALLPAWMPHALGDEPDALYLRLWLVSIADVLYGVGESRPVAAWSFSRRVRMLRLLEEVSQIA